MFFVWTSEGGPLQYVGLAMFVLQVLPRVFPDVTPGQLLSLIVPGALLGALLHAWITGSLVTIQQDMVQRRDEIRRHLTDRTGEEWTNTGVGMVATFSVVSLGTALLWLDTHWWAVLSQLLAIGVVIYTQVQGPMGQPQEHAHRQAKFEELAALIQAIPMEECLPESAVHEAPVAQLREMLRLRGCSPEELDSFVDKQNLVEALAQKRNTSDSCCICFETYEPGEPVRVLPNCGHELHVECLDKWVYTFSHPGKRQQDPTCPLCKKGLKKLVPVSETIKTL